MCHKTDSSNTANRIYECVTRWHSLPQLTISTSVSQDAVTTVCHDLKMAVVIHTQHSQPYRHSKMAVINITYTDFIYVSQDCSRDHANIHCKMANSLVSENNWVDNLVSQLAPQCSLMHEELQQHRHVTHDQNQTHHFAFLRCFDWCFPGVPPLHLPTYMTPPTSPTACGFYACPAGPAYCISAVVPRRSCNLNVSQTLCWAPLILGTTSDSRLCHE